MGLSVIKFLILIFKLLHSICRNYQANDKMIWLPFYPYSPFTALGKTSLKCYMKWQDLLKTFRGILTLQSTRFSDWPVMAQKFSTKFRGAENTRRTFSSAPDTNWNLLIIAKHLRSYPCIWGLAISCQVTWVPKKIKKKKNDHTFQKLNSFQQAKYQTQNHSLCHGNVTMGQIHTCCCVQQFNTFSCWVVLLLYGYITNCWSIHLLRYLGCFQLSYWENSHKPSCTSLCMNIGLYFSWVNTSYGYDNWMMIL